MVHSVLAADMAGNGCDTWVGVNYYCGMGLMQFGLTPEALIARRAGLGGSDAPKVLAGGEAWMSLWEDKTGRVEPKPAMSDWNSALRHHSEILNLDWYEHSTGREVGRRGEVVVSSKYPFMRATLDGWDIPESRVIQAKHVSSFTPDPIQWCIEHYSAQLTHEMIVTDAKCVALTIIVGMNEPEIRYFDLDPFYADAYIARCNEFWEFVRTDTPPPREVKEMKGQIPLEQMRRVDMSASNSWAAHAGDWIAHKDGAAKFKAATDGLKELVEEDARECVGHGIKVVRNKAGSLSVRAI